MAVSSISSGVGGGSQVSLRSRRLPSGTIMTETGGSQFYSKYNIIPMSNDTADDDDSPDGAALSSRARRLSSQPQGGEKHSGMRFPKLEDCAHFHYEFVDLGNIEVSLVDDNLELDSQSEAWLYFNIASGDRHWTIRRTYESLHKMDAQLHRCIYDRRFSLLPELTKDLMEQEGLTHALSTLSSYLIRFSLLAGNMITCGPVLSWMEMDNHGNRLIGLDTDAAINTPAVGAAHAIQRYVAQTSDELSFEVGDMLSIIDKPPPSESAWWRGKKNFEVGFFPSECVEMINDSKLPATVEAKLGPSPLKPVLHKRGKLISLLRAFFTSRPARAHLKRTGIVRERVFGCDLGEHLMNSGLDVPLVLRSCAQVIESHGIVDGIYRLSGVASNIQKLRTAFDDDDAGPSLTDAEYLQDIHSVSSLLKMYFRELPNPLFTYQLYDKFADAVGSTCDGELKARLDVMRNVIQQLPPPHYRTAEFLLRHLSHVASRSSETSMTCRNLAIVWAPNLLRSKELDQMACGAAALKGVGLQAIVTEFLISNVTEIFDESVHANLPSPGSSYGLPFHYRSQPTLSPTKLLSLEEAQERVLAAAAAASVSAGLGGRQKYIEVGGGPSALPRYHTVIELSKDRKVQIAAPAAPLQSRRTSSGWKSIFSRSRSASLKDESVGDSQNTLTASMRFIADGARDETIVEEKPVKRVAPAPPLAATPPINLVSEQKIHSADSLVSSTQGQTRSDIDAIEMWQDGKRRSVSCDIPLVPSCSDTSTFTSDSDSNLNNNDVQSLLGGLPRKRSIKQRTNSVDVPATTIGQLLASTNVHPSSDIITAGDSTVNPPSPRAAVRPAVSPTFATNCQKPAISMPSVPFSAAAASWLAASSSAQQPVDFTVTSAAIQPSYLMAGNNMLLPRDRRTNAQYENVVIGVPISYLPASGTSYTNGVNHETVEINSRSKSELHSNNNNSNVSDDRFVSCGSTQCDGVASEVKNDITEQPGASFMALAYINQNNVQACDCLAKQSSDFDQHSNSVVASDSSSQKFTSNYDWSLANRSKLQGTGVRDMMDINPINQQNIADVNEHSLTVESSENQSDYFEKGSNTASSPSSASRKIIQVSGSDVFARTSADVSERAGIVENSNGTLLPPEQQRRSRGEHIRGFSEHDLPGECVSMPEIGVPVVPRAVLEVNLKPLIGDRTDEPTVRHSKPPIAIARRSLGLSLDNVSYVKLSPLTAELAFNSSAEVRIEENSKSSAKVIVSRPPLPALGLKPAGYSRDADSAAPSPPGFVPSTSTFSTAARPLAVRSPGENKRESGIVAEEREYVEQSSTASVVAQVSGSNKSEQSSAPMLVKTARQGSVKHLKSRFESVDSDDSTVVSNTPQPVPANLASSDLIPNPVIDLVATVGKVSVPAVELRTAPTIAGKPDSSSEVRKSVLTRKPLLGSALPTSNTLQGLVMRSSLDNSSIDRGDVIGHTDSTASGGTVSRGKFTTRASVSKVMMTADAVNRGLSSWGGESPASDGAEGERGFGPLKERKKLFEAVNN